MESKKKKKVIEQLQQTAQIPITDKEEQLEVIIKKQEDEIAKYKAISIQNLNKYFL